MSLSKKSTPLKLLLVVGDSPSSMAAASLLTHIIWPPRTSVHILTWVPGQLPAMAPSPEVRSASEEALELSRWRDWAVARALLTPITHALRAHNLAVETEICEGPLPKVALARSIDLSANLVVIGATGLNKAKDLGLDSTVQKLVYGANCSVLVVRSTTQVRPLSVILAVHDSAAAWQAVEFIQALSLADWAKVTVTNIIEAKERLAAEFGPIEHSQPANLQRLVREAASGYPETCATTVVRHLRDEGVQGWETVRYGRPAGEILDVAREREAVLIVMGASSQTRSTPSNLGSVVQEVVREAPCSVLIVR